MPCRCGMVKLMRLDIRENVAPRPKSIRVQTKEKNLLKQRIQRITRAKPSK
jgi:hypothetical protein